MTRIFWLSFVDLDRPEGDRFQGVSVVEINEADIARATAKIARKFPHALPGAELIVAAIGKARETGCNPHGEVQGFDITDADPTNLARLPRHRLLSRAELDALGMSPD